MTNQYKIDKYIHKLKYAKNKEKTNIYNRKILKYSR